MIASKFELILANGQVAQHHRIHPPREPLHIMLTWPQHRRMLAPGFCRAEFPKKETIHSERRRTRHRSSSLACSTFDRGDDLMVKHNTKRTFSRANSDAALFDMIKRGAALWRESKEVDKQNEQLRRSGADHAQIRALAARSDDLCHSACNI
jgi:hypothetical protein